MPRIPVILSNSENINLLPGRQNILIQKVLTDFCALYTPAGRVLYISLAKVKWAYFDTDALRTLGVEIEEHGKMPDVVVHHVEKDWLVLIEAVTSHGPVDPKRRQELMELFAGSKIGLVFVTAFLERRSMIKYLNDISWETKPGLPNPRRIFFISTASGSSARMKISRNISRRCSPNNGLAPTKEK